MTAVAPATALHHLDAAEADPATLAPDERTQAAAYRHALDRHRFVTRRAWLRERLAAVTGEAPDTLRFARTDHGRPYLPAHPDLHFSLSHSAGWAALVLADRPVGCDLEARDPAKADPEVANRFFAPRERAALAQLEGEDWIDGFYAAWTRKEAYVKALGLGLSLPLQDFAVTLGAAPALLDVPGWAFHPLPVPPGFSGALAIRAA